MKYRTTQKAIKNGFSKIISVGYCNLQHLLNCETETAYTTRREGWAADIYDFGNVAIVTGYAPFGNIRPDYETVKKYDNMDREIIGNIFSWEERKNALRALIENFIEEVITK